MPQGSHGFNILFFVYYSPIVHLMIGIIFLIALEMFEFKFAVLISRNTSRLSMVGITAENKATKIINKSAKLLRLGNNKNMLENKSAIIIKKILIRLIC